MGTQGRLQRGRSLEGEVEGDIVCPTSGRGSVGKTEISGQVKQVGEMATR